MNHIGLLLKEKIEKRGKDKCIEDAKAVFGFSLYLVGFVYCHWWVILPKCTNMLQAIFSFVFSIFLGWVVTGFIIAWNFIMFLVDWKI